MKKISLFIAGCLLAASASAQYGQRTYPHLPSTLSSGKVTNLTPGFITSGFYPYSTVYAMPDLVIEKTNTDGQFVLASDFGNRKIKSWQALQIIGQALCF